MAAFNEHEGIILKFEDQTCKTKLQNGTLCKKKHCPHTQFACHLDDDDLFNRRFCAACRTGIYATMELRKDDLRQTLKKQAMQGENVFLYTGRQLGLWYEYEHVNTGEIFSRPEEPSTNEEIQRIGTIWLSYKDEANARTAKMFHQTKLTKYFK